ncbi:MAG: DNA repair protein RecO [Gammaproteobacteria bacterium RIFCSPHIGHO2_12_FULL_35_23]|nr:MAG: DNA repair protein RecO [Gammaproteobacteria bacterium RIFCSPHIGHO2_12_FULL_35_23]
MTEAISLKILYILHSRPYRDTSLLLECLTLEEGLISLVARGAKRPKSPYRNILQLFTPLLASWYGKGDLKTLKTAELAVVTQPMFGQQLFKGFYINELLLKVLHRHDPCPVIFKLYQTIIASDLSEVELRKFELSLLAQLGYGLQLTHDVKTQQPIQAEYDYYYDASIGFTVLSELKLAVSAKYIFKGSHIIAIYQGNYQDPEILKSAKRLSRVAFMLLLGNKPLKSRELFITYPLE